MKRTRLEIGIVCPADTPAQSGNRVTARRWGSLLRELGHHVTICRGAPRKEFDALVVLHARKGAEAALRFRAAHRDRPLFVALTGTDVYGGMATDPQAQRALEAADRVIALQAQALAALSPRLRAKTVVVHQSAAPL